MGRYILFGTSSVVTGETKSFFSFAKSWWQVDKISPLKLYDDNKFLAGFQLRQLLFRENQHEYVRQVMDKLFTLYTDGTIKPVIDQVASFEDIAEAMQRLHDRKNIGKIILDPTIQPKVHISNASIQCLSLLVTTHDSDLLSLTDHVGLPWMFDGGKTESGAHIHKVPPPPLSPCHLAGSLCCPCQSSLPCHLIINIYFFFFFFFIFLLFSCFSPFVLLASLPLSFLPLSLCPSCLSPFDLPFIYSFIISLIFNSLFLPTISFFFIQFLASLLSFLILFVLLASLLLFFLPLSFCPSCLSPFVLLVSLPLSFLSLSLCPSCLFPFCLSCLSPSVFLVSLPLSFLSLSLCPSCLSPFVLLVSLPLSFLSLSLCPSCLSPFALLVSLPLPFLSLSLCPSCLSPFALLASFLLSFLPLSFCPSVYFLIHYFFNLSLFFV
ncbi:Synaptic vesicle membrane protein VAT-1 homolog-like [Acanthosepion pharaonis]|uniref:Synaptic vesicle membrane protein VAT-1 homolog-like n=1 Tax=Acanthosepion pharaonis TaxID=158019 RepID=A0A812CUW9_ACAPH|nr:Synaptic vesicle membrane protein VAT-1 homolog-like [Sepia pharaonis]